MSLQVFVAQAVAKVRIGALSASLIWPYGDIQKTSEVLIWKLTVSIKK